MKHKLVSAIITTKNSSSTLESLLDSIRSQSYKHIEIIVVDNFSTDDTKKLTLKYTHKFFTKGPERSVQRNFGVKKAEGEYILILDSDMVLTKNVVEECVSRFDEGIIGGIVIPEKSVGEGMWTNAKILERELNQGEDYFEAARFFSKTILKEFGGYDENLTGPEDWELPRRIGLKYKIARIRSKILHNEGCLSIVNLFWKKYYYGLSAHKFLEKQNLPLLGPHTVYFLRSGFYKNWKKLFRNPVISLVMFVMLVVETIGGGLGYLVGRFWDEK